MSGPLKLTYQALAPRDDSPWPALMSLASRSLPFTSVVNLQLVYIHLSEKLVEQLMKPVSQGLSTCQLVIMD
jgi:hypothetical protein